MANVRAFRSGNWSDTNTTTSPWATGGVVYAPEAGDDVYSNNFTITIDTSPTVTSVTNAAATSRLWKDGATTTATAGGGFTLKSGQTLTATVNTGSNATLLTFSETGNTSIVGDIYASATNVSIYGVQNTSSGTVSITGNCIASATGPNSASVLNSSSGLINVTGNVSGGNAGTAIRNAAAGSVLVTGNVEAGSGASGFGQGIFNATTGTIEIVGNVTASPSQPAVSSTNANSLVRCSGSFFYAVNGQVPIYGNRVVLNATPLAAKTRYALNGSSTFLDMFTADNSLGQANPTDVRNGVSYASGTLTGKMLIPARGAIASGVAYGPTMPFTATRSGTTATATLTYSYPYQVGDIITVSDASNPEWNMDYTIASIVSGNSVTFEVPSTHSSTAGTGANMQTKGTSTLDVNAVAAAVWGAATRTITGGTVDTLTNAPASVTPADIWSHATRTITGGTVDTLTNAPTVPSASAIASQVRTELTTELGRLDASVSSRLADADYVAPTSAPTVADIRAELATELGRIDASISSRLADADYVAPTTPPTAAEIATAVESSILNEGDGQQVLNAIVGAIGNSNVDEIALVAAIRSDLERTGGKLDSIPTTSAPSASTVAGAVRSELTTELSRIDQTISSRLASADYTAPTAAPTAAQNASAVRSELSVELARLDAPVSGATAPSAATVASAVRSELSSELTKVSALNTDRLANVATTQIVGTLLAQSQS